MARNTSMTNATFGNESVSKEEGVRDDVLGGTLLTINVFIVMLNSLAVLVIMRFRTKNCIDILVLGLAMTDLTKGLVPVPMAVYTYLTPWFMKTGSGSCDFFGWIAFTTNSASMLILTIMAIERFVAVVRPFAYRSCITKRRMEMSVLVAVVFSAFISLVPFLGFGRMKAYNNGAYCHFDYTYKTAKSNIYSVFILSYGLLMTFVVLVTYSIVFYKIRDLIKRHKRFAISRISSTSSKKGKKDEEINLKVEKMFSYLTLGLMLLFWFSWFPFLAVLLLNLVKAVPLSHDKVDLFAMRVAVVNSMLNPIACASFCKPYRRGFFYYYRKLLSYAGFARPDSDVFDPWRQKSQITRDPTPAGSFAAPVDSRAPYNLSVPEFSSQIDPEPLSSVHTRCEQGASEEPIHSQPVFEDDIMEQDSVGQRLLQMHADNQSVTARNELGFKDDAFDGAGCAITEWKQNRSREQNVVAVAGVYVDRGVDKRAKVRSPQNHQRGRACKTNRYSVPLLRNCVNAERKPRPKSLEGFSRKYGKFRPWSLALNEGFHRFLEENAFDNDVKLTAFSVVEMPVDQNVQCKSNSNTVDVKICKRAGYALQRKAKSFNGLCSATNQLLPEFSGTERHFGPDALTRRKVFAKGRSFSLPTTATTAKK